MKEIHTEDSVSGTSMGERTDFRGFSRRTVNAHGYKDNILEVNVRLMPL